MDTFIALTLLTGWKERSIIIIIIMIIIIIIQHLYRALKSCKGYGGVRSAVFESYILRVH